MIQLGQSGIQRQSDCVCHSFGIFVLEQDSVEPWTGGRTTHNYYTIVEEVVVEEAVEREAVGVAASEFDVGALGSLGSRLLPSRSG